MNLLILNAAEVGKTFYLLYFLMSNTLAFNKTPFYW